MIWPGRDGSLHGRVRAIYAACPVRVQCLDDALAFEAGLSVNEISGMFGGATPEQRIRLARERRAVAV